MYLEDAAVWIATDFEACQYRRRKISKTTQEAKPPKQAFHFYRTKNGVRWARLFSQGHSWVLRIFICFGSHSLHQFPVACLQLFAWLYGFAHTEVLEKYGTQYINRHAKRTATLIGLKPNDSFLIPVFLLSFSSYLQSSWCGIFSIKPVFQVIKSSQLNL